MRLRLLALGLLVVPAALASSGDARAQAAVNYPWCAYLGGNMGGGGVNCGFSTYEQCQADISGIGGYCMPNTQYQPATGAPTAKPRKGHRQS